MASCVQPPRAVKALLLHRVDNDVPTGHSGSLEELCALPSPCFERTRSVSASQDVLGTQLLSRAFVVYCEIRVWVDEGNSAEATSLTCIATDLVMCDLLIVH